MNTITLTNPLFKIKNMFKRKPIEEIPQVVRHASNRVEPLKTEFASTKELFQYAKMRCLNALHSNEPYEHAIVADTKKNKIIAEYIGDRNSCSLEDLPFLELDKEHTIIFHGHLKELPLSSTDLKTLINSNTFCNVAFNPKGEFSLAYKTKDFQTNASKEKFKEYALKSAEETYDIRNNISAYGEMLDYLLRIDAKSMGLKYVSNYNAFAKNKKAYETYINSHKN